MEGKHFKPGLRRTRFVASPAAAVRRPRANEVIK